MDTKTVLERQPGVLLHVNINRLVVFQKSFYFFYPFNDRYASLK